MKRIIFVLALLPLALPRPALCAPAALGKTPSERAVREKLRELFGAPVDEKLGLYEVNRFYVLRAEFDGRGRLSALAVEPKHYFDEAHPEWEEPDDFAGLSEAEFESLLARLDAVRPRGALVKSYRGVSVVTNMTERHREDFKHAVLETGEVRDYRRGDNPPREIRFFRLRYR